MTEEHITRLKGLLVEQDDLQKRIARLTLETLASCGAGATLPQHFMAIEELVSGVGLTNADLLALLQAGHTHTRTPWPFSLHDERLVLDRLIAAVKVVNAHEVQANG